MSEQQYVVTWTKLRHTRHLGDLLVETEPPGQLPKGHPFSGMRVGYFQTIDGAGKDKDGSWYRGYYPWDWVMKYPPDPEVRDFWEIVDENIKWVREEIHNVHS